jgi:CTP synthase
MEVILVIHLFLALAIIGLVLGTRFIFITGGVVSSLARVLPPPRSARCLQARGYYKVRLRKLDPYLNVDPGTMSPYQHGEVYVTDDGAETDLDLGHYERFTGVSGAQVDNITTGRIYSKSDRQGAPRRLSGRHRAGDPARHRRDQGIRAGRHRRRWISCWSRSAARSATSRACRSSRRSASSATNLGRARAVHPPDAGALHPAAGELKTKPTQHSVKELRSIGIQPDILLCRCDRRSRPTSAARSRCSATCAKSA